MSKPRDTLTEALAAVREREAARVNLKCSVMMVKSGTLVNPISARAVVHYDNDNDCLPSRSSFRTTMRSRPGDAVIG